MNPRDETTSSRCLVPGQHAPDSKQNNSEKVKKAQKTVYVFLI